MTKNFKVGVSKWALPHHALPLQAYWWLIILTIGKFRMFCLLSVTSAVSVSKSILANQCVEFSFERHEQYKWAVFVIVWTHTSYNSFTKWSKISSLGTIIFELKNDGKKGSRIYFEIDRAPSELLLPSAKMSAQNGRIGLAAYLVSLKGLGEFQNKF